MCRRSFKDIDIEKKHIYVQLQAKKSQNNEHEAKCLTSLLIYEVCTKAVKYAQRGSCKGTKNRREIYRTAPKRTSTPPSSTQALSAVKYLVASHSNSE